MHRALSVAAVSLVALLSVAAAGCGGDDQSSAEQWANTVCTDLNTWADSITTAITGVMSQGLSVTRSDLRTAANQAQNATSRLVDDLRAIGPPDTDSGEQAQQELQQLGDSIEQHANKTRELVEGASSARSAGAPSPRRAPLASRAAARARRAATGRVPPPSCCVA